MMSQESLDSVFYKKIIDCNLHYVGKRLCLDLRLSQEVFAHYLTALSVERISKHLHLHHKLPDSVFPLDEYLKALLKPNCDASIKPSTHFTAVKQIVYRRTDSLRETESTSINPLIVKETIVGILMEYALEYMTSFYNVLRKDFGIQCNTVDCYRGLEFYKCCQYDQALQLCERILKEPDLQKHLKEFSMVNVLLFPPLDSFFDRDVQSLLGFHTLFYYL